MRRLLQMAVVLALVGLADPAYSQSPELLEEKYGFKIFKFGTRIDEHQDSLKEWSPNDLQYPLVKHYQYTGNCCQALYGVEMEHILLSYYKDVLFEVMVTFNRFSEQEHRIISGSLEQLLGQPQVVEPLLHNLALNQTTGEIWKSSRVHLELIRYKEMGAWVGYMLVQESEIYTRSLADEF